MNDVASVEYRGSLKNQKNRIVVFEAGEKLWMGWKQRDQGKCPFV